MFTTVDRLLNALKRSGVPASLLQHSPSSLESMRIEILELDSLSLQELSIQLYLEFGRELSATEILGFSTLGELFAELQLAKAEAGLVMRPRSIRRPDYSRVGYIVSSEFEKHAVFLLIKRISSALQPWSNDDFNKRTQIVGLRREFNELRAVWPMLKSRPRAQKAWRRVSVSSWMYKYERRIKRTSADPVMLVAFTGRVERLMMPVSLFLAVLPPNVHEVLLVLLPRSAFLSSRANLRFGAFQDDLHELEEVVRRRQRQAGHKRILALGASAGSLPAYVFSVLCTGISRCLLLGPQSPHERPWANHSVLAQALNRREESLEINGVDRTEVSIMYGEASQRDLTRLPEWSTLRPDSIQGFDGLGHTLMLPLFERGSLSVELEHWINGNKI